MSNPVKAEHLAVAEKVVAVAHANNGLAPLDLEQFWRDDAKAHAAPFAQDCPQMPLAVRMGVECIFAELGVAEDWYRLYHDADRTFVPPLARQYNDKAVQIVGRRLLSEKPGPLPHECFPPVKQLHDVFEARSEWHAESRSYWLHPAASTEEELQALLDRVESRLDDLRRFLLPPDWASEKQRLAALGVTPSSYRGQRGPVTFATSIYGVENLIFLLQDNPALAARFRDLILRAILERARILDEEAGFTPQTAPRGWSWWDDNCCMLNAEMYEFFGWPILNAVFARHSPAPSDWRYQHSDSPMGHLLPLLGKLNLTRVNFGPTLSITEIREHLPQAVIEGQLAPFTFSRNEEVSLVAELLRDFEHARQHKGVVVTTAGGINSGSRLTGMRLLMSTIQQYCRYN
jgi:uroporphyrinogen decarboxylase